MQTVRRTDRTKSFLRAQIVFNNRQSILDCLVKSISPLGARVAIADDVSLPAEFELNIPQKGRSYRARMAWRDTDSLGVEFEVAGAPPESKPAAKADNRESELETEVVRLKARVRALTKRLEDLGQDPNDM